MSIDDCCTNLFRRISVIITLTSVCYMLSLPSSIAYDVESHAKVNKKRIVSVMRVRGKAVTGSNRLFNEPIWDLGEALGFSGFNFIFGYNPEHNEPLALTRYTPRNTILASGFDRDYLALFGLTPNDIKSELVNIPVHKMPVLSGPSGEISQLPSVMDVGAKTRSRIASNKPVTLKKWLSAKAIAKFKCYSDGTSTVGIRLKSLIPNSIYSAWGVYSFDTNNDGLGDQIGGVPLGGVPNILLADSKGTAKIFRKLNFCPRDEPSLKYLTVAFHSDANINGAVPDQALLGLPGGTIAHAAISFPINVVTCNRYKSDCL